MIELTAVVSAIIGIVEALKRSSNLNKRHLPLLALTLGVTWYTLTGELSIAENFFSGIVAGLSASGLYSSSKATLKS